MVRPILVSRRSFYVDGDAWNFLDRNFLWMKIAFHPKFSSDASFFAARDVKNLPRPKAEKPQNGTVPHIHIVPWVEPKSWPFKGGVLMFLKLLLTLEQMISNLNIHKRHKTRIHTELLKLHQQAIV